MRYDYILRFQMELRQLHTKYRTIGLDADELTAAAVSECYRLAGGAPEEDPEEQKRNAEAYEKRYTEDT